ncbi:pyridoxamine 5'-phosphate oxidase family protein [Janibacter sp. GS2]|uniref:pyridoxamine 5'-phosphate oxidase family protein n=1 Tax=Janibacter sp. GS2 TaxID=3442646 RepID=UPI003EC080C8
MADHKDLVTEIMKDTRIAVLTYVDERGRLVSMPMGTQDFDDPGVVHFLTRADADKMPAIAAHPQVNVAYSSDSGWVSLSGAAQRNDDQALLEELWDASASAFMPGGPEDPNCTVLTVTADTASYWESPGKAALVIELAKGVVSDHQAQPGDSGTVSL